MPWFDPDVWKARASQRFNRACSSHKDGAGSRLFRDMTAINGLQIVIEWCRERSVEVYFRRCDSGGVYDAENKVITINGHLAPEKQLFVLLHECGHHLIGDRSPRERYGHGYSAEHKPGVKRTLLHRVDVLDEELEAWHRGHRLAKRLDIKVDPARYNWARSEYVKTYLQWATRVNRKKRSADDGKATPA